MILNTRLDGDVAYIQLEGDMVGPVDETTRNRLIELIKPGRKLIVDLSQWNTCSGLGLRRLLLLFRWAMSQQCQVDLHGIPDEFRHCAEAAGFTDLFFADRKINTNTCVHISTFASHRHLSDAIS